MINYAARKNGVGAVDGAVNDLLSAACCEFMTEFMIKMCNASAHRIGDDLNSFVKILNEKADDEGSQIVIKNVDNVQTLLSRIAQRETIEQDRIFNIIGMNVPEEDAAMAAPDNSLRGPGTPEQATTIISKDKDGSALTQNGKKEITKEKDASVVKEKGKKTEKGDSKPPRAKKNTKKDLPEAVKHKLANNAALREIGGPTKSWMLPPSSMPGGSGSIGKPVRLTTATNSAVMGSSVVSDAGDNVYRAKRGTANQRISLKDALFAMENTRALKRSDLIYKWYANIK